jgi:hypothetical protein
MKTETTNIKEKQGFGVMQIVELSELSWAGVNAALPCTKPVV